MGEGESRLAICPSIIENGDEDDWGSALQQSGKRSAVFVFSPTSSSRPIECICWTWPWRCTFFFFFFLWGHLKYLFEFPTLRLDCDKQYAGNWWRRWDSRLIYYGILLFVHKINNSVFHFLIYFPTMWEIRKHTHTHGRWMSLCFDSRVGGTADGRLNSLDD